MIHQTPPNAVGAAGVLERNGDQSTPATGLRLQDSHAGQADAAMKRAGSPEENV